MSNGYNSVKDIKISDEIIDTSIECSGNPYDNNCNPQGKFSQENCLKAPGDCCFINATSKAHCLDDFCDAKEDENGQELKCERNLFGTAKAYENEMRNRLNSELNAEDINKHVAVDLNFNIKCKNEDPSFYS